MTEYPLYVNAYGKLVKLFEEIKKAAVPPKFTQDYLTTMLGFKSSSDRAFLPLLKRIGFLNQANEPTEEYKKFRDSKLSGTVMAKAIKSAYPDHFNINEFAYKLSKDDFSEITKRITGASKNDKRLSAVTGTFFALKELADFEMKETPKETGQEKKLKHP